MKSNKKAFTIVELVIVIAIIAILAAVLIPTFANVLNKANVSKDTQLIRNLNTALTSDRAANNNKPHQTLYDALQAAEAFGYDVGKINASAIGNEILWDQENDVFCYLEGTNVVYLPELVDMSKRLSTKSEGRPYHLWKIFNDDDSFIGDGKNPHGFSIYWNGAAQDEVIIDGIGFDAGTATVSKITYTNNQATARAVIVRTNSANTELNIDAQHDTDTVNHFGTVGKVLINNIGMDCYNEYGKAAYIKLLAGKVIAKEGGEIAVIFAANDDGSKVAVLKDGGTIGVGYTLAQTTHDANLAREGGIDLAFQIDGTINVTEDLINSIAEAEVEKTKAEENEQKTGKGPWGTIISVNENFWGGLLLNVGDEYDINDITDGWWTADPEEGTFTTSSNPDVVDIEIEYSFSFEGYIIAKHPGETIINLYEEPLEESESDPAYTIKVIVIDTLEYEASIGDTNYATIEQAFDAALSMDNATVKLLGFVNRSSLAGISIASGNWVDDPNDNVHESNKDQIFEGRKSLTLDLNGNTIHTDLSAYDVNLTIIDSSEDKTGKIDGNIQCGGSASKRSFSEQDQKYVDYDWSDLTTYHLNGGTYKKFNMVGNVNVIINGASIICTEPTPNTATIASNGANHSDLTIIYGAFSSVDALFSNHPDNTYEIRGGYFSRDITDLGILSPGYSCVNVGGLYKVVLGD